MSAKWRRIKRWDAEHLTGWMTPVRLVLLAFSSITMAVVLLVFVALYAVLASVPIGLLALIPTWVVYGLTLVAAVGLLIAPGVVVIRAALAHAGRPARFAATFLGVLILGAAAAALWARFAWPALRYDPVTGGGFRLFHAFVRAHDATTLRRLPGFEMTELEFYGWWPLRLALLLFCCNLIVATARRIEFNAKNLGVLTVHAGIILIAVGSVFYNRFKQEGDTIVLAGAGPTAGDAVPGPPQRSFYDNTAVVLYVAQRENLGGPAWEQRPLRRLPRYNDYALDAAVPAGAELLSDHAPASGPRRALDLAIPPGDAGLVDPDLRFRVVGYASYAELERDWARSEPAPGERPNPLREVDLYADLPPEAGPDRPDPTRPVFRFALLPDRPDARAADNAVLAIDYTIGLDDARWSRLAAELPAPADGALIVTLAGEPEPVVLPAAPGRRVELGDSGLAITLLEVHPEPPFPIITPGYEGATSPVAVVRIETPGGDTFERWLYARFPELDQDIRGAKPDGRPDRQPADPSILDVGFLDASRLSVHFDERADGSVRAIVRQPGGGVRAVDAVPGDRLADIIPGVDLAIARRWAHAAAVSVPVPVPEPDRDKSRVGTHDHAFVAVEVTSDALPGLRRVVWVPFSRYLGMGPPEGERSVSLPDGRTVRLAFGRRQRPFPGFEVSLLDFEMIAYDHRGAPRDYQSVVRVEPRAGLAPDGSVAGPGFEPYDHVVKLNAPLRAPYHWDPGRPWITNMARRLGSGLNPRQFKLSQAGWDQQGWRQSQQLADAGQLPRPFARYTILGVGNNPGIHVIALGGIMMGVGIPWAFYVKPWLVRREKRRLAARANARKPTPVRDEIEPKPEEVVA